MRYPYKFIAAAQQEVRLYAFALVLALSGSAVTAAETPPPTAAQRPHVVSSPNGDRTDPYYWLRDDHPYRKRTEVMAYLSAENAYTDAALAHTRPLQRRLLAEMRSHIEQHDRELPVFDNGYWRYRRYAAGSEYPVYLRRKGSLRAAEEVVLDVPKLAAGKAYYTASALQVSPDNRRLAFVEDAQGRRIGVLRLRDLATGRMLPDRIHGVLEQVAWAADSRSLFYVRQDPVLLQSGPVYRHVVGTDPRRDELVYDEPDKSFLAELGTTASHEFVTIRLSADTRDEWLTIPAREPQARPRVLIPRSDGHEYTADHLGGRWFVSTNEQAPDFRLVEVDAQAPADRSRWRELVPAREGSTIESFALIGASHGRPAASGGEQAATGAAERGARQASRAHRPAAPSIPQAPSAEAGRELEVEAIAVNERVGGNLQIRVLAQDGRERFAVRADEPAFDMRFDDNPEPGAPALRYRYESLVTPPSVYEIDLASGERRLLKRQPVPRYDPALYASERLWAPSRDGSVKIPVSIVYRKDRFRRDGTRPLLQEGYGSYGLSTDADFDANRLSLLDRGFVYAIAHVRGGGELGRAWVEGGRMMNKRNSFDDFVAVTDFLVGQRYTAADKVFAQGWSAGGLLMGGVVAQAPAKYRAVLLGVPFVDVVTTMLDETIPLTTNEFTQWGNPKDKAAYDYMLSYSPYDQLRRGDYPAMLVTTALWDSQVQYYEPTKYVAKLRTLKTDSRPLLLHVDFAASHSGRSGRFAQLDEVAREYAFFLDQLGERD